MHHAFLAVAVAALSACTPLGGGNSDDAEPVFTCAELGDVSCTCVGQPEESADLSGTIVDTCDSQGALQCCFDASDSLADCLCVSKCFVNEFDTVCDCRPGSNDGFGRSVESCTDAVGGICCQSENGDCRCDNRITGCFDVNGVEELQVASCESQSPASICARVQGAGYEPIDDCADADWPAPASDDPPSEGEGEPECSSDSDCSGCRRCGNGTCDPCGVSPTTGECTC